MILIRTGHRHPNFPEPPGSNPYGPPVPDPYTPPGPNLHGLGPRDLSYTQVIQYFECSSTGEELGVAVTEDVAITAYRHCHEYATNDRQLPPLKRVIASSIIIRLSSMGAHGDTDHVSQFLCPFFRGDWSTYNNH